MFLMSSRAMFDSCIGTNYSKLCLELLSLRTKFACHNFLTPTDAYGFTFSTPNKQCKLLKRKNACCSPPGFLITSNTSLILLVDVPKVRFMVEFNDLKWCD